MFGFLYSVLLAFTTSTYLVQPTNGLTITLETITLDVATTISYVSASNDPSNWLLRNVYANGTTQIGGVLSGTGTVSFTFQVAGPHFLQAIEYNKTTLTATSEPFYTGNLFTPIDASSSSSSASSTPTSSSTIPSTSCPSTSNSNSASTSPSVDATTTKTNNTGAIAGGIIGGLGFLAALVFFGLWFRLRREYKRKPNFRDVVMQQGNGNPVNGNGNNNGVILTPLMVPPYATAPTHVSHVSSSSSPTSGTDISSPIFRQGQQGTKRRLPEAPMSSMPTMAMASGVMQSAGNQSDATFPSSFSQHTRGDSGGGERELSPVSREITELRREVEQLRQLETHYMAPPSY